MYVWYMVQLGGMKPILYLLCLSRLSWAREIETIYFKPEIPKTLVKSFSYHFKIMYRMDPNDIGSYDDGEIGFLLSPYPYNPSPLGSILDKRLCINPEEEDKSGVYNFSLFTDAHNTMINGFTVITFYLIAKSEIHLPLRDFYFRNKINSSLFTVAFKSQHIQKSDFNYRIRYDVDTFRLENDTVWIKSHGEMQSVYRLELLLFYNHFEEMVIGSWRVFVIFIEQDGTRLKLTDFEMDKGVNMGEYQVDYNDPIYQGSTFDPLIRPAIPIFPRLLVTRYPDLFNKASIFTIPYLMMFAWMLLLLTLIILTLHFAKCQHFLWVPLDREVVEIDPLDSTVGFGMCFFDFWLNLVGHDKQEQHCFLELWKDKFGNEFPEGICRNCISHASNMISQNNLVELTDFEARPTCTDNNCKFQFFQRQLRLYDDRVPGFDCEVCSKEAYIQLLRTSYAFNQE